MGEYIGFDEVGEYALKMLCEAGQSGWALFLSVRRLRRAVGGCGCPRALDGPRALWGLGRRDKVVVGLADDHAPSQNLALALVPSAQSLSRLLFLVDQGVSGRATHPLLPPTSSPPVDALDVKRQREPRA